MNVVIVALDFKPNQGGVAEYTYQLARELHERGDRVSILSRTNPQAKQFDAGCPLPILRQDWNRLRARGIRGYPARYRMIERSVEGFEADLLLANTIQSEAEVASLVARRHRIPFATFAYGREVSKLRQLRSYPPRTTVRRWLELQLGLKRADRVFCISGYAGEMVKQLGVREANIVLIPPAVSLSALAETDPEVEERLANELKLAGRPLIMSLARLIPRKGIDVTLRALPQVLKQYPDLLYIIAGNGPYMEKLVALTTGLGIANNVHFAGYVSEAEKKALYQLADVFVMPNREEADGEVEGFGIVFLEANYFGTPVIGGRSGGAVDAIVDGETGLLVPPEDPAAVATAVLHLLEDEALAQRLGQQGQERVLTEMNYGQVGRLFRQELLALVSPDRPVEAPAQ